MDKNVLSQKDIFDVEFKLGGTNGYGDTQMNNTTPQLIVAGFAFVPYLFVSWGYAEVTGGGTKAFWIAFVILLGVRLFFSIIETIGSVLSWRLYSRKFMVQRMLEVLRANKFPKRFYAHDDILNYLARIEDSEEISPSVKSSAKQLEFMLGTFENLGILAGARMYSAVEAALEAYSPRSAAKELSFED